jgi:hypothetical protein
MVRQRNLDLEKGRVPRNRTVQLRLDISKTYGQQKSGSLEPIQKQKKGSKKPNRNKNNRSIKKYLLRHGRVCVLEPVVQPKRLVDPRELPRAREGRRDVSVFYSQFPHQTFSHI